MSKYSQHSEILGVRDSMYEFGGDTIQPIQAISRIFPRATLEKHCTMLFHTLLPHHLGGLFQTRGKLNVPIHSWYRWQARKHGQSGMSPWGPQYALVLHPERRNEMLCSLTQHLLIFKDEAQTPSLLKDTPGCTPHFSLSCATREVGKRFLQHLTYRAYLFDSSCHAVLFYFMFLWCLLNWTKSFLSISPQPSPVFDTQ